MKNQMNPRDWEILSTYLDDQLTPAEKARLQQRLNADPLLKTSLEELRRTRAVLRAAPRRRVPRNFTLAPAMVRSRSLPRLFPVFGFASALASLLFAVLLGIQLSPNLAALSSQQAVGFVAATREVSLESGKQAVPIIVWGPPNNGYGGGGDLPGVGGAGGPGFPINGIGGGPTEATTLNQELTALPAEKTMSTPTPTEEVPPSEQPTELPTPEIGIFETSPEGGTPTVTESPQPTSTPEAGTVETEDYTEEPTQAAELMDMQSAPTLESQPGNQLILGIHTGKYQPTSVSNETAKSATTPVLSMGTTLGRWVAITAAGLVAMLSALVALRMWRSHR